MIHTKTNLTVEEFLNQPETDITHELIDGQAIPKMSPKRFHSRLTGALYMLLTQWCQEQGEVGIEWAVKLTRQQQDWVPVPDLLYISYTRLSRDRLLDEACPVPPELVIEIISPGQSFGDLAEKAVDYLNTGVLRVWVVDIHARTITVFYPDAPPQTFREAVIIKDALFEGLQLSPQQVFQQAGL